MSSTLLTLFVLPVLYSMLHRSNADIERDRAEFNEIAGN
jgi:Cu/Ag efflux pump CusA